MVLSTNNNTTVNISWKTVDTINDKVTEFVTDQQIFVSKNKEHQELIVDGAATTTLTLNSVTKASAYLIVVDSRYNGDNSTTENAVAAATIALGGGTAYTMKVLLVGSDAQLASSGNASVVITTIADTDTTIKIYALGVL